MNAVVRLCLSSAFFVCGAANAIGPTIGGPTVGLWYNPQETGRGFNIDLQGDTMIVTTFVYQQSGDPIWYLSSGTTITPLASLKARTTAIRAVNASDAHLGPPFFIAAPVVPLRSPFTTIKPRP